MSLLDDIAAEALDPGYASAAAAGRRPSSGWTLGLTVLVAALLFAVAAVQAQLHAPANARLKSSLVSQIQQLTAQSRQLQRRITTLTGQVDVLRAAQLSQSATGSALAAQLSRVEAATGATAMSGAGLVVSLNSAPVTAGGSPATNQILDSDVQAVVNALWAAGARAIAVNGERVSQLTAIRSAGSAILVDFTPLSPPYVIDALGSPVGLETAFGASRTAATYRTYAAVYGLQFSYRRAAHLSLPGASLLSLRYAS